MTDRPDEVPCSECGYGLKGSMWAKGGGPVCEDCVKGSAPYTVNDLMAQLRSTLHSLRIVGSGQLAWEYTQQTLRPSKTVEDRLKALLATKEGRKALEGQITGMDVGDESGSWPMGSQPDVSIHLQGGESVRWWPPPVSLRNVQVVTGREATRERLGEMAQELEEEAGLATEEAGEPAARPGGAMAAVELGLMTAGQAFISYATSRVGMDGSTGRINELAEQIARRSDEEEARDVILEVGGRRMLARPHVATERPLCPSCGRSLLVAEYVDGAFHCEGCQVTVPAPPGWL